MVGRKRKHQINYFNIIRYDNPIYMLVCDNYALKNIIFFDPRIVSF